jgi:hypothetical protein
MSTSSDFKVIAPLMPWGVRRTPATSRTERASVEPATLKRRYQGSAFRTRRCPADGSALQEIDLGSDGFVRGPSQAWRCPILHNM